MPKIFRHASKANIQRPKMKSLTHTNFTDRCSTNAKPNCSKSWRMCTMQRPCHTQFRPPNHKIKWRKSYAIAIWLSASQRMAAFKRQSRCDGSWKANYNRSYRTFKICSHHLNWTLCQIIRQFKLAYVTHSVTSVQRPKCPANSNHRLHVQPVAFSRTAAARPTV